MDTFTIYCQWCRERGMPPPTREWWDKACAKRSLTIPPKAFDDAFDITTEQREGWAYD